MGKDEATPLVPCNHFEYQNRPVRDVFWTVLYCVCVTASVVVGFLATLNGYGSKTITEDYLKHAENCPLRNEGRRLLETVPGNNSAADPLLRWTVSTAVLTVLIGLTFVLMLKKAPILFAKFGAAVGVLTYIAFGILHVTVLPDPVRAVFFFAIGIFVAWVVYKNYKEGLLDLCGRLFSVATEALFLNPRLLALLVLHHLLVLTVVVGAAAAGLRVLLYGKVVSNPVRQDHNGECTDAQGHLVSCCASYTAPWVYGYLLLLFGTTLWTLALGSYTRLFVTAGTIIQWYHAPPSSLSSGTSKNGTTLRCVKYAMGPSFGSLCFGSAIITTAEAIQMQANRQFYGGVISSILSLLAKVVMLFVRTIIEGMTRYAVVRCAATGESLYTAGRSVTEFFTRNGLQAIRVWFLPPFIVRMPMLAVSFGWFYGVLQLLSHNKAGDAVVVAPVCGVCMYMMLDVCCSMWLHAMDAVYFCYALDVDAGANTRDEVHAVYSQVPTLKSGLAVENPGGEYAYGLAADNDVELQGSSSQSARGDQ